MSNSWKDGKSVSQKDDELKTTNLPVFLTFGLICYIYF